MTTRLFRYVAFSWLGVLMLSLRPGAAAVDDIRVLCSNGIKSVVEELVPEFERSTNQRVAITYGVSASLARQIDAGEPFDVAILTASLIDEAVDRSSVQRGSQSVLARSAMALGIRRGRPKPAVATVEGLKSALRSAASIAYAREGASAPFFTSTLRRLGLTDEIAPKIRLTDNGVQAATMVAKGDAELCVLPTSEILPVAGLDLLGAFPEDVKGYLVMVAGISAHASQPAAAAWLIRFLGSPAAAPVLIRKGMERPGTAPGPVQPAASAFAVLSAQHVDETRVAFVPPGIDWERAAPAELRRLQSGAPDAQLMATLREHLDDYGHAVMPYDVPVPNDLRSRSLVLLDAAGAAALQVEHLKGTARVGMADAAQRETQFFGEAVARTIGPRRAGGGFVLTGVAASDVKISESRRRAADLIDAKALEAAKSTRFWTIVKQYELKIGADASTYVFVQWAPDDEIHEAGCQYRFTIFKLTPAPIVVASSDYGCDV